MTSLLERIRLCIRDWLNAPSAEERVANAEWSARMAEMIRLSDEFRFDVETSIETFAAGVRAARQAQGLDP